MNEEFNKENLLKSKIYKNYLKEFALHKKDSDGYIYIRVSTKRQTENSPETQLKEILEYALINNIYIPEENIFIDAGISGRNADKRKEFQNLINIATQKKTKCNKLLVHKYDRFARNRDESGMYKSILKKAGIRVISVKEQLPKDKKSALVLETQYEMLSELYSINLSDEVYKGLRPKAMEGKHMTKAPYGYKKIVKAVIREKGKDKIIRDMIINDDEAKIVKLIFEKFINGSSVLKIAQELNEMGISTRSGHPWYDNRVRYILNNITYLGYTHWTELGMETTITKSTFSPIIDSETWEKKETIMQAHKKIGKAQVKRDHWLRGKLRCSNCNNVLVLTANSFQCCGYTHGECLESHSIKIEKMENLIISLLKNLTKEKIININLTNLKIQNNDEITIIENTINQLNTKIQRIMQAYENEIYTLEEFKERKEKVTTEIEKLNKKLKSLKKSEKTADIQEQIYKKCDNVYNVLIDEKIPVLDKQIVIDTIIDRIIFDKKNKTIEVFYKN